jgi:chaperonin GroEL
MNLMTDLVSPTLGPLPRTVAIAHIMGTDPPEILDSGATIARRTLQLADPFDNMGAMLIRHLTWRMFDRVGDGSVTAAVIARALVRTGFRHLAAGANPVHVRRGMECALAHATAELRRQAHPIDGPPDIARLVRTTVRNSQLEDMLGEVVDAAGPDGAILVEDAQEIRSSVEYVDGVRWNEGFLSTFLLPNNETSSCRLLNPRVLVTDRVLEHADQLVAILEACVAAGDRNLFVIAPDITDSCVGLLVLNRERGVLDGAMAVRAPSIGTQRLRILEDLGVITGGRCVIQDRGDRLEDVTAETLGTARQAWATRSAFGIVGGYGSKAATRQRIAEVRAELAATPPADAYTTSKIQERIGKLAGTTAIIRVGAASMLEQAELKLRIEAAVRSARSALRNGAVPGGGGALLRCAAAVEALEFGGDERLGATIVARALAEPMRTIFANAGLEIGLTLDEARQTDLVYDVLQRRWVDPWREGLVDPLEVQVAALETSVSTAALALTSEVLVHRKDAPTAVNP